jgi:UDP-N-acetylmuramate-alanine ligase
MIDMISLEDQQLHNDYHKRRIIAVIDLGSNTLQLGTNNDYLITALQAIDGLYLYADPAKVSWDLKKLFNQINKPGQVCTKIDFLLDCLKKNLTTGDIVVFMSNGGLANAADQLANSYQSLDI